MKNIEENETKITFIADKELVKDIDDFGNEMHISTRSESVRQLIVKGLTARQHEKRELKYG